MLGRIALRFGACGFAVIALASGCAAPWSPPTAAEILQKPGQSDMRDGHFNLKGHFASGAYSTDVTGGGIVVLKPHYAASFTLQGSIGQLPFAIQEVVIDDKTYTRIGTQKWTEQPTNSKPGNLGSDAKNAKLIGEDNLSQGKAWHVQATIGSSNQPFDAWVRESDGYLTKYSSSSDTGTLSLDFDKFNTGQVVSPPNPADIKPPAKNLTGQVGSPLALNGVTVTVVSVDLNAKSGNEFITPKAGSRFVAVQILYENTGTDPYDFNPFDWKLTDSAGFSYETTYSGIGPELHSGTLQPGEKARGYMTFEVPSSATGLMLKLTSGDDSAVVPISS
jgi:hypothetical protein